jgi:hypothetical protein
MNPETIARFRRAVETGDTDGVLATLSPEITFANPVTAEPLVGREALAFLVPKILDTWKGLRYVAELHGDGLVGLVFDAGVGSKRARGIDVLRLDEDGLIAEITVMVRPLTALRALSSEMQTRLAAG